MARVQTSKQGHRAFSLTSGKRTEVREPTSPSAIARWSQATGVTQGRAHGGPLGLKSLPPLQSLQTVLPRGPDAFSPCWPCGLPEGASMPVVPATQTSMIKAETWPFSLLLRWGRDSPLRRSCPQVCKSSLVNSTVCTSFFSPRHTFPSLLFFYSEPSTFHEWVRAACVWCMLVYSVVSDSLRPCGL